jgi:hypothetical protein
MDDPLFLLMQGIWLFAAGMYPLGFLFGACSACCDECQNSTCEGFDLEQAYALIGNCGLANKSPDLFEGYGPFGGCGGFPQNVPEGCADATGRRRRSCMRWLCRCYESTGEKSEGNPDIASWYTVVSEEEKIAGGPTTNDLDLSAELDASMAERDLYLSGGFGPFIDMLDGPLGTRLCLVWAFTFYGHTVDCETTYTGVPSYHESADDCYTINPCGRCGLEF